MNDKARVHYPKAEVRTVLLPVTYGCSYNNCAFCAMYKDDDYGEVPFYEIKRHLINIDKYTERIFLTGADPLSIGFKKMKKLLALIHEHVPYCACVACYASIRNIAQYTVEELSVLHDAGLRKLYIGFETGSDDVLKMINKPHTAMIAVIQAQKLNIARLSFNTIIMYGIAGEGRSVENALATAEMINQFKSDRIVTMNLTLFAGTPLYEMAMREEFFPASDQEKLIEIKTLLENLDPQENTIFDTNYATNIIKMTGTLPYDRRKLINKVSRFIRE